MQFAIVIEKAANNYAAYVPDLPGCVATGATVEEVEARIREAIALHLDGLREDGCPIPVPESRVEYIEESSWLTDSIRCTHRSHKQINRQTGVGT